MKISIGKTFTRSQVLDMGSDTGTNCVCDANSKKRQRQKVVVLMANDKQDRYAAGVVTIRRGEVFRVMVGDGDHGCYCVGTAEDESLAQIIAEGWLETVKRMKEKADD